ncbi:YybH family protein [Conexibacter woesei]|uniref:DUF4440 domain-containing protein n=1 Tax=Conexibacter woesei (strain DSM 14684 / CCUG 47730 / CIP 108061 / JCM 11494 / NBRC 100937 / ID131577) TaxID=469383 RepID=D3F5Z3_CONWI|nr:SgcJ/EcaC family oxidoreductase [Conexibacter woesei]ADB48666.1 hypothetical protein Cwoe_0230 [Conexibacter woesei DSM 14684]
MEITDAPTAARQSRAGTQDEDAIRAVIADVETGFNTNDADLLSRHFAGDAKVVAAFGQTIDGREAIDEANRQGVASPFLKDATAHYTVSSITFVEEDVALVRKLAWSTAEDESAGKPPEMVALYVFVRRDGRWWIAARQNTLIGQPA